MNLDLITCNKLCFCRVRRIWINVPPTYCSRG